MTNRMLKNGSSLSWGLLALLGSCATAEKFTALPMMQRDNHTSYADEETSSGFTLFVNYSRYQHIPESNAVDQAATSQMLALAYEVAEQRGRKIERVNEQRIRKSMGRNAFSGITSWSGMVPVVYVDETPPATRN